MHLASCAWVKGVTCGNAYVKTIQMQEQVQAVLPITDVEHRAPLLSHSPDSQSRVHTIGCCVLLCSVYWGKQQDAWCKSQDACNNACNVAQNNRHMCRPAFTSMKNPCFVQYLFKTVIIVFIYLNCTCQMGLFFDIQSIYLFLYVNKFVYL